MRIDPKRVLRLSATALMGIVLALLIYTFVLAWLYTEAVLNPGCQGDFANLEEAGYPSELVEFESPNGDVLRGWFAAGARYPDIAIIVLPGHAGNTRFSLFDAEMLASAGYSTLIYEHRSCANADLAATTGYEEATDLRGAAEYLSERPDVAHIGAMGFSEGGTAILLAAAQEDALEAVVAMGGYADLRNDILDPQQEQHWYAWLFRRMVLLTTGLHGVPVKEASPVSIIQQTNPRPVLLIYGEYEASAGQWLHDTAPYNTELWIVPGAGHGNYHNIAPVEYNERVINFFTSAFE